MKSNRSLSTWLWIALGVVALFAAIAPIGFMWSRSLAKSLVSNFAGNPTAPLSQEQEAVILNYADRNTANRPIQQMIVQAALDRLQSHDADIFMGLVERYRASPQEWRTVMDLSIGYINKQSPGADLALSYLRQRVAGPKVDDLEMTQILNTPRDMKLIAAIALMFETDDLIKHQAALQRLMNDEKTPPGVRGLIRNRIDGGTKGDSDAKVEGTNKKD